LVWAGLFAVLFAVQWRAGLKKYGAVGG
jgi:hypothetical protein